MVSALLGGYWLVGPGSFTWALELMRCGVTVVDEFGDRWDVHENTFWRAVSDGTFRKQPIPLCLMISREWKREADKS